MTIFEPKMGQIGPGTPCHIRGAHINKTSIKRKFCYNVDFFLYRGNLRYIEVLLYIMTKYIILYCFFIIIAGRFI